MPPQAQGAYNSVKQALSIFSPFNKTEGGPDQGQGMPNLEDAYESKMSDERIIALTNQWKRDYAIYFKEVEQVQKTCYEYWLGKQTKLTIEDMLDSNRNLVDNRIFIELETSIPLATKNNPDVLVTIDPSASDQQLAPLVRAALTYQADRQRIRMLNKSLVRDWDLNKIGVFKVMWDVEEGDIRTEVVNPQRMIFDKDGYVSEGGWFTGDYIGERKLIEAGTLQELFPKHKEWLKGRVGGKEGTKLEIIEWWYKNRDYFFTLEDRVLGKFKNHLWNYDGTDENGVGITGINHFSSPRAPYLFLSVYSTRQAPHDDTSRIQQALGVQDMVNRRFRQIDKNAESTNNGLVVNGQFNSEQASLAAEAIRKGGAIRAPGEILDVTKAVMRLPAPPLANYVYENLVDARKTIAQIFGTSGSTPEGVQGTQSVRGKILVNQMDASRIGGSITAALEQVDDSLYNFWLQIMYVYYDLPHYASALGTQGAQELTQLKNVDLRGKIQVTVKEGSLVPRDPLTERNEAMDLWGANAINPISLYQKLEYPDPYGAAKDLLIWQLIQKGALQPQAMFPDFPQMTPVVPPQESAQSAQPNSTPASPQSTPPQDMENPSIPSPSNEAVATQGTNLLQSVPMSAV